jgi:hypothetical protein
VGGTTIRRNERGHQSPSRRRAAPVTLVATLAALAVMVAIPVSGSAPAGAGAPGAHRPAQPGYRLLAGDGGIFTYGAPFVGSAAGTPTGCPPNTVDRSMPHGTCWSMATLPSDQGYWILNAYTGAVTPFGAATFHGDRTASNTGGADLWPTSVAIASTPDGQGYWILNRGLSGFGTLQAFGDATFYGDESTALPTGAPNGAPVGIVVTPNGRGYWIVDSDGGVFAFGDASYVGSMGRAPDGGGYWLAAADGGVFAFGDAAFGGSVAGTSLNAPVVGMAADPAYGGYWLTGSDGGVFALGGAPFLGSMGGQSLNQPVFAISAPNGGIG